MSDKISPDDCVFFCEAAKGYVIKIIIDTLAGRLQKTKLIITPDGIFINETDEKTTILFNIELLRQNFRQFKCIKKLCVKLNLKYLQRLIKSTKKKDTMSIYIKKDNLNVLFFKVCQESDDILKSISETNYIPIEHEDIPEKFISSTDGYRYPVVMAPQHFQKIKKLIGIRNKLLNITIQRSNYIKICTDDSSNYGSDREIGKLVASYEEDLSSTTSTEEKKSKKSKADKSSSDKKDASNKVSQKSIEYPHLYNENFEADQFSALIKLAGLQQQIQFYSPENKGYPLLIKLLASNLGNIDIFIKDIERIRFEESQTQNDIELVDEKAKRKAKKAAKIC